MAQCYAATGISSTVIAIIDRKVKATAGCRGDGLTSLLGCYGYAHAVPLALDMYKYI